MGLSISGSQTTTHPSKRKTADKISVVGCCAYRRPPSLMLQTDRVSKSKKMGLDVEPGSFTEAVETPLGIGNKFVKKDISDAA
jgi:hypothetical protein